MKMYQDRTLLLGAMLRIPFQAIVARIDRDLRLKGFTDLRPAHFVIFQHIRLEGSHITDLAERAQITKQSMGDLVNFVEACGYIERVPDPHDRRAKMIRLTARGLELNAAARESVGQIEKEWADRIGVEQMNALKQALWQIIQVIEAEGARKAA